MLIRTCEKTYDELLLKEVGIDITVRLNRKSLHNEYRKYLSQMDNYQTRNCSRNGLISWISSLQIITALRLLKEPKQFKSRLKMMLKLRAIVNLQKRQTVILRE